MGDLTLLLMFFLLKNSLERVPHIEQKDGSKPKEGLF